jgi:Putative prokaryotic signal transducing protein
LAVDNEKLMAVGTYPNKIDAELALSALEAADIEAIVTADDAGGLQPGLWVGEGVRVLVRAEDAERAKEILGGI